MTSTPEYGTSTVNTSSIDTQLVYFFLCKTEKKTSFYTFVNFLTVFDNTDCLFYFAYDLFHSLGTNHKVFDAPNYSILFEDHRLEFSDLK